MKTYSPEEWKKAVNQDEEAQILDVRDAEAFRESHIPGAKNVDVQDPAKFMESINDLEKDKGYYVYCNSGNRSNQACLVMDHEGFGHVYNLKGGMQAWNGEVE